MKIPDVDVSEEDLQEIILSGDQLPKNFGDEVLPIEMMLNPVFDGDKIIDEQKGE